MTAKKVNLFLTSDGKKCPAMLEKGLLSEPAYRQAGINNGVNFLF
jgi:hypothetical protein